MLTDPMVEIDHLLFKNMNQDTKMKVLGQIGKKQDKKKKVLNMETTNEIH